MNNQDKTLTKKKSRLGCVDVVRFLMISLIMAHHLYILGFSESYPGASCWAWVDYFFILTGFFTMRHFIMHEESQSPAQSAIHYTIKKFKGYIPYVFIATFTQYFISAQKYLVQHNFRDFVKSFTDFPYEFMMLSSSGIVWPKLAPIWFLSAMLLTLPIIIYMILRFRDLWYILAWLLPVLYYGKMGINTSRTWPNDLIRAIVGMALGTFVFMLTQKLKNKTPLKKRYMLFLTLTEIGCLFLCVYITVLNICYMNLLLLLFVINSTIMLSGCSYTSRINGFVCTLLGEISLPMFLFHCPIGHIAGIITTSTKARICIYYIGTILVSCIAISVKHKLQNAKN